MEGGTSSTGQDEFTDTPYGTPFGPVKTPSRRSEAQFTQPSQRTELKSEPTQLTSTEPEAQDVMSQEVVDLVEQIEAMKDIPLDCDAKFVSAVGEVVSHLRGMQSEYQTLDVERKQLIRATGGQIMVARGRRRGRGRGRGRGRWAT